MVTPSEDQHAPEGGDSAVAPAPVSYSETVAGLAAAALELAELTQHVRQLSAGLAQELEAQRAVRPPPPLSAGQLSSVFLAEDGLGDELRRHCAGWRQLAAQVTALRGRLRAHLLQRLLRRQAAARAGLACLVRALDAAVSLLLQLTAFRVYSRTDVTHLEKLLALLSAVHQTKSELLAAARQEPAALPGLRLFRLAFCRATVDRPPSVEGLCDRLARVRAGRLAAALEARLAQQVELDGLLRQRWPARRPAGPPADDTTAGTALRLPPIPTILIERSSPTSGYGSSGGDGEPGGAERTGRAPPADLARLLRHEENAVHSLLLAVPAGGPRLLDPHLSMTRAEERLTGGGRRRLVALYRDAVWRSACGRLQRRLLWTGDAGGGRPALAAAGAPAALHWLDQTLDRLSDELSELGLPRESLSARLRLPLAPVYAAGLLTPALHLSQSTLHASVPLEGGQQCTKCGKLYYDSVSFLVCELNTVLSAQSAALAAAGAGEPDAAAAPSDLLPLLRLQLQLQRLLAAALHQLTLWVTSRSQLLLAQWQTSAYFLITMADLPRCLLLVDSLQPCPPLDSVSEPGPELEAAMTARTESGRRLDRAVLQLQGCRTANLSSVSEACRRTALQSLAGLVPGKAYWRRPAIITSQPSDYVRPFIGEVLEEVLTVVSRLGAPVQLTVAGLVVKVACYSWMEHIMQNNIKFSSAGARQLCRDVAALRAWLRLHPLLSAEARRHALAVDALRELEGVTQLLQRQPREPRHNQVAPAAERRPRGSAGSLHSDDIPPEMYVRQRDAWLRLRLHREDATTALLQRLLICRCCMWPN